MCSMYNVHTSSSTNSFGGLLLNLNMQVAQFEERKDTDLKIAGSIPLCPAVFFKQYSLVSTVRLKAIENR